MKRNHVFLYEKQVYLPFDYFATGSKDQITSRVRQQHMLQRTWNFTRVDPRAFVGKVGD